MEKKNICKNPNIYCKIELFSAKDEQKQNCTKYGTFLKSPWPSKFKFAKIFLNINKSLVKTENVQIAKCRISSQKLCNLLPFVKDF